MLFRENVASYCKKQSKDVCISYKSVEFSNVTTGDASNDRWALLV
jgi:hypothetical protein